MGIKDDVGSQMSLVILLHSTCKRPFIGYFVFIYGVLLEAKATWGDVKSMCGCLWVMVVG